MSDERRPYRKKRRAELEEQTRMRIAEAAMELHGSVGPARTTISAVAQRAGVQRGTVYRHFPDDQALFAACSSHWLSLNPPPDVSAWAGIEDPDARLAAALEQLYGWYGTAEEMMANLIRDEPHHPAVPPLMAPFWELLDAVADLLMAGRPANPRARAALRHAVDFRTWHQLTRDGRLVQADVIALMRAMVAAA